MTASEQTDQRTGRPEEIEAVPVRHPGRWAAGAIIAVIAASIIRSIVTAKGFQWSVVGQYLVAVR